MDYSNNKGKIGEYGVHKLWFYYDDERNDLCDMETMFPPCLEIFPTFHQAEKYRIQLDTSLVRGKHLKYWGYRGEFMFTSNELKNFLRDKGWAIFGDKETLGHIPKTANDKEIEEFLYLSGIRYHMVIEHKNTEEVFYGQLTDDFWDKTILNNLQQVGQIRSFSLWEFKKDHKWINGEFITDFPQKNIEFTTIELIWYKAICLFLNEIKKNGRKFFFWNEAFENWSDHPVLFKLFISNSKLFNIISISTGIALQLKTKLQELNPYNLKAIEINEMKVFINLLKIKPFQIHSRFLSVNGNEVKNKHEYNEYHCR